MVRAAALLGDVPAEDMTKGRGAVGLYGGETARCNSCDVVAAPRAWCV